MKAFASDNYSPVHPHIMDALIKANQDHAKAYGEDIYTKEAVKKFKKLFGESIDVYFVFTGTAANVLGLQALLRPWQAVICAETAHIQIDECGAPEHIIGSKLLDIPSPDGKLRVYDIEKFNELVDFEHHVQPKVISISQTTELGTIYSPDEIRKIANYAHANNMYLHMDGARIANAAAALNMDVKSFSLDCGVDVLSFGGTKNGMMYGEAIIFANESLAHDFKYIRKQSMQLASKMRYISAQFCAYLQDDLYLKTAAQANAMAKKLEQKLADIPQINISRKTEANAVFAVLPRELINRLLEHYFFYEWDALKNEVRWMCSWDISEDDIDKFVETIKRNIGSEFHVF